MIALEKKEIEKGGDVNNFPFTSTLMGGIIHRNANINPFSQREKKMNIFFIYLNFYFFKKNFT